AARTGDSRWITSARSRALGHRWRAEADAVLVGVGTILADDPRLTARGAGRNPLRVVLDTRLRTPTRAKVADGSAPTVLFTAKAGAPARIGRAAAVRVPKGRGGLDLE